MRKLAWAALSFAASVLLRHYVLPQRAAVYVMAALGVVAGVSAFVPKKKIRMGLVLVCVFALLGIARYEWQLQTKVIPTESLVGQEYRVTMEVVDYPEVYEEYTRITAKLVTAGLPETRLMLYDYEPGDAQWKPGNKIQTLVRFTSATVSAGETTDSYISKGIYLRGYAQETPVSAGTDTGTWRYAPLYLGKLIRDRLTLYMTPRTAAFMEALLTGEKTDLYAFPEVYNIITRSGISHVVAVSGMHVSFMVGLMVILLGNRWGWIGSILFGVLFSLMTGMSPSVLRALLMQILFLTAPVFRRESDAITSLSFPLLVLLFINPFAIASLSLQLSFAAMCGIVLVTPRAVDWFAEKGKRLTGFLQTGYRYISASLSMSLGATIFILPLCAGYFGSITVLAPLTNLLVLWLVPICFAGGFGVFLLSFLSAGLAGVGGALLSRAVELLYALADLVAELPFAAVYLPGLLLALWFAVTYGLVAVTYFTKGKKLYRPMLPGLLSVGLLIGMALGVRLYYQNGVTVGAVDVGQGQSIALLSGEDTLLIDCGGNYDAGDSAAKWLYAHGRSTVDTLVITHFDRDHVSGVIDLLVQVPVKELVFCGIGVQEEEAAVFHSIREYAEHNGTQLRLINKTSVVSCGAVTLNCFVPDYIGKNDGLAVLAQAEDFELLVTGDSYENTEKKLVRALPMPQIDCLVAGHHGSQYSTGEVLLDSYYPKICIISCGYNSYGHPSEEVLDRLAERNVVVYRTDKLGDITLKVR